MPERSEIWHHFEKDESTGKAICNICQEKLAYKSTTANLKSHLRRMHAYVFSMLETKPRARGQSKSASVQDPLKLPEVKIIIPGPSRSTKKAREPVIKIKQNKPCDTSINKVHSDEQRKLIDTDLLDLCVDSFLPLSIVEERAFRKFCRWIPGYQLPTRKTLATTIMNNAYIKCMDMVRTQVREEVQSICLTADMWTSLTTENYIALTGHYINQNLEAKIVLLGCCQFLEHHTAENIASDIGSLVDKYNLRQKVNFIVTNNSDNIVTATKEILNWKHFRCYAHSLNLMVEHALRNVQCEIDKVRKIVSDVKKSTIYSEKLERYQIKHGLQTKQLTEPVDTSWNSTFFMLQRFVELEDAIRSTLSFADGNFLIISPEDFILFKQLCQILHPFEEISTSMREENYVTGSSVIVVTQCLIETCQKLLEIPDLLPIATDIVLLLKSELEYQFKLVETSGTFAIATFLDPRFKMKGFTDTSLAARTKEKVQSLVAALIAVRTSCPVPEEQQTTSKKNNKYDPWSIFDEIVSTSTSSGTPLSRATKEVDMYLADELLPRIDKTGNLTCPLEWWKTHQYVYPNLRQIFITRCNIVASSVSCERMYSESGLILNERRTRLTTSTVEQMMFLHVNSPAKRFEL